MFIQNNPTPTLAEIGASVGHDKAVVLYHVRKLAAAGLIVYTPGTHRSIRIQEVQK
jgi:predicted transcriptional regulator